MSVREADLESPLEDVPELKLWEQGMATALEFVVVFPEVWYYIVVLGHCRFSPIRRPSWRQMNPGLQGILKRRCPNHPFQRI